jgi:hypothetical protein
MSDLSNYAIPSLRVNTTLWRRGGQSPHSVVHPKHPMRLCETRQVQSLKEMQNTLSMGMSVVNTLGLRRYFLNSLFGVRDKPLVNHVVHDLSPSILRLTNTLVTTEEFLKTDNALDALIGSLRLALDAIEAQFWYLIFTGGASILLPINTSGFDFSYREVLAYGRAAIHRIAGTENVHVLVPVIHYAAMLLDNTTGIATGQQSAVTEHHLYDSPRATIIPVAHNHDTIINNITSIEDFGTYSAIAFYPDYLPSLIVRYIYEEVVVEKISETSSERNLRRVVLGRYLSFELPLAYDQGIFPAMPVVFVFANAALNNVMAKYSTASFNLPSIVSF